MAFRSMRPTRTRENEPEPKLVVADKPAPVPVIQSEEQKQKWLEEAIKGGPKKQYVPIVKPSSVSGEHEDPWQAQMKLDDGVHKVNFNFTVWDINGVARQTPAFDRTLAPRTIASEFKFSGTEGQTIQLAETITQAKRDVAVETFRNSVWYTILEPQSVNPATHVRETVETNKLRDEFAAQLTQTLKRMNPQEIKDAGGVKGIAQDIGIELIKTSTLFHHDSAEEEEAVRALAISNFHANLYGNPAVAESKSSVNSRADCSGEIPNTMLVSNVGLAREHALTSAGITGDDYDASVFLGVLTRDELGAATNNRMVTDPKTKEPIQYYDLARRTMGEEAYQKYAAQSKTPELAWITDAQTPVNVLHTQIDDFIAVLLRFSQLQIGTDEASISARVGSLHSLLGPHGWTDARIRAALSTPLDPKAETFTAAEIKALGAFSSDISESVNEQVSRLSDIDRRLDSNPKTARAELGALLNEMARHQLYAKDKRKYSRYGTDLGQLPANLIAEAAMDHIFRSSVLNPPTISAMTTTYRTPKEEGHLNYATDNDFLKKSNPQSMEVVWHVIIEQSNSLCHESPKDVKRYLETTVRNVNAELNKTNPITVELDAVRSISDTAREYVAHITVPLGRLNTVDKVNDLDIIVNVPESLAPDAGDIKAAEIRANCLPGGITITGAKSEPSGRFDLGLGYQYTNAFPMGKPEDNKSFAEQAATLGDVADTFRRRTITGPVLQNVATLFWGSGSPLTNLDNSVGLTYVMDNLKSLKPAANQTLTTNLGSSSPTLSWMQANEALMAGQALSGAFNLTQSDIGALAGSGLGRAIYLQSLNNLYKDAAGRASGAEAAALLQQADLYRAGTIGAWGGWLFPNASAVAVGTAALEHLAWQVPRSLSGALIRSQFGTDTWDLSIRLGSSPNMTLNAMRAQMTSGIGFGVDLIHDVWRNTDFATAKEGDWLLSGRLEVSGAYVPSLGVTTDPVNKSLQDFVQNTLLSDMNSKSWTQMLSDTATLNGQFILLADSDGQAACGRLRDAINYFLDPLKGNQIDTKPIAEALTLLNGYVMGNYSGEKHSPSTTVVGRMGISGAPSPTNPNKTDFLFSTTDLMTMGLPAFDFNATFNAQKSGRTFAAENEDCDFNVRGTIRFGLPMNAFMAAVGAGQSLGLYKFSGSIPFSKFKEQVYKEAPQLDTWLPPIELRTIVDQHMPFAKDLIARTVLGANISGAKITELQFELAYMLPGPGQGAITIGGGLENNLPGAIMPSVRAQFDYLWNMANVPGIRKLMGPDQSLNASLQAAFNQMFLPYGQKAFINSFEVRFGIEGTFAITGEPVRPLAPTTYDSDWSFRPVRANASASLQGQSQVRIALNEALGTVSLSNALPGAMVSLTDSSDRAYRERVGSDGTVSLAVGPGTYTMRVHVDGYNDIMQNITLNPPPAELAPPKASPPVHSIPEQGASVNVPPVRTPPVEQESAPETSGQFKRKRVPAKKEETPAPAQKEAQPAPEQPKIESAKPDLGAPGSVRDTIPRFVPDTGRVRAPKMPADSSKQKPKENKPADDSDI